MAMNLIRTQAGDGIFVNLIKDDRFKHDRISVSYTHLDVYKRQITTTPSTASTSSPSWQ